MPDGIGIMPRGSFQVIEGELLRFFCHWKERSQRTDYDLSAVMLDSEYGDMEHVSWTNYQTRYATYSGDITEAPDGASEFIDIRLGEVTRKLILPQVYVYCGEDFEHAEESFFGWMLRGEWQSGAPFEARSVRTKSGMRGAGKVVLPIAFIRGDDGRWRGKWMHLYLKGTRSVDFPGVRAYGSLHRRRSATPCWSTNQVEGHRLSTSLLTRAIIEREYLTVGWLLDLVAAQGTEVVKWDGATPPDVPVTFIGLEQPENLAPGSRVITLQNLLELIPE
jgi:hypothetical protein